jgi:hypothetical protein
MLKTDVPTRETHIRHAQIRARIAASQYLVDFGESGGPEFAFFSGAILLAPGEAVTCRWYDEAANWFIVALTTEGSPTEQVHAADVRYTPANEGHW